MKTSWSFVMSLALALCVAAAGCRDQRPTVPTAPFEHAVNAFLEKKGMQLTVHEIKTLDIRGGNARAKVSLAHATGATNVKVEWSFHFRKEGSRWRVISYQQ